MHQPQIPKINFDQVLHASGSTGPVDLEPEIRRQFDIINNSQRYQNGGCSPNAVSRIPNGNLSGFDIEKSKAITIGSENFLGPVPHEIVVRTGANGVKKRFVLQPELSKFHTKKTRRVQRVVPSGPVYGGGIDSDSDENSPKISANPIIDVGNFIMSRSHAAPIRREPVVVMQNATESDSIIDIVSEPHRLHRNKSLYQYDDQPQYNRLSVVRGKHASSSSQGS